MQAAEIRVKAERLDQLIRWHGTDETQLPHPDTLKNLSPDTVAALHELGAARETIKQLRAAMGRAFCATEFRQVRAILLDALGPPPDEDSELPPLYQGVTQVQSANCALASSAQNTAST